VQAKLEKTLELLRESKVVHARAHADADAHAHAHACAHMRMRRDIEPQV
jgi:hypothetical protein